LRYFIKIWSFASIATFALSAPLAARDLAPECQSLYEETVADITVDLNQCTPQPPSYELTACKAPSKQDLNVSTSHLILAIDASGSMAGKIGGKSKMDIAKSEALNFLKTLQQEISVGLVVYGHKGNNKEDGRAESCAAAEMVHGFNANRAKLADSIKSLKPTGWTPIGGVLDFASDVISKLPNTKDTLAPVVYVVSDGEETCDGDPVRAARDLFESGTKTVVNTIGFAIDKKTQAQLEDIAQAGGGAFYLAENQNILRKQLAAIAAAKRDQIFFEQCVLRNSNRITMSYQKASSNAMACYKRNEPSRLVTAVMKARKEAMWASCGREVFFHSTEVSSSQGGWITGVLYPFSQQGRDLASEYWKKMGFESPFK